MSEQENNCLFIYAQHVMLGNKKKILREQQGMSIEALAALSGMEVQELMDAETAKQGTSILFSQMYNIAKALGVNTKDLLN